MKLYTERDVKNQYFLDFYKQAVMKFEKDWLSYEQKLKKYLSTFNNFKDWAPQ